MPTYGYLCRSCNEGFEIKMSIREKETRKVNCPSCGSRDVVQQIFGFFVTGAKGSGEGPTGCCPPGRSGCCE
jgi:putative FmdB family regulatory protein